MENCISEHDEQKRRQWGFLSKIALRSQKRPARGNATHCGVVVGLKAHNRKQGCIGLGGGKQESSMRCEAKFLSKMKKAKAVE